MDLQSVTAIGGPIVREDAGHRLQLSTYQLIIRNSAMIYVLADPGQGMSFCTHLCRRLRIRAMSASAPLLGPSGHGELMMGWTPRPTASMCGPRHVPIYVRPCSPVSTARSRISTRRSRGALARTKYRAD